jgi:hypothetical protein
VERGHRRPLLARIRGPRERGAAWHEAPGPPGGRQNLAELEQILLFNEARGIELHLASQKPGGRPGAHADRIDPEDFRAVVEALDGPADLMLEAKDKDLALFALRQDAAGVTQPATL